MFQRGLGYEYNTEKVGVTKDGDEYRIPTRAHMPADPNAAFRMLEKLDPVRWAREKPEGGETTVKVVIEGDPGRDFLNDGRNDEKVNLSGDEDL